MRLIGYPFVWVMWAFLKVIETIVGVWSFMRTYDNMKNRGYDAEHFGGGHPYDMLANGKRIEVKSSIAQYNTKNTYKYRFQNIKTSLFDKIILVFVTPYEIIIQQMSSEKMAEKLMYTKNNNNGKTFSVLADAA